MLKSLEIRKSFVSMSLLLGFFLATSATMAVADVCRKPQVVHGATRGNWSPIDNTGNFDRFTVSGEDYFKKVRGNVGLGRTVRASRCPTGTAVINFGGALLDQCITYAQEEAPYCNQGNPVSMPAVRDVCSSNNTPSNVPYCIHSGFQYIIN
jgi:hypothetical protein